MITIRNDIYHFMYHLVENNLLYVSDRILYFMQWRFVNVPVHCCFKYPKWYAWASMHDLKRYERNITACRIRFGLIGDFYLWRNLKQQVYDGIPITREQMKERITRACLALNRNKIRYAVISLSQRFRFFLFFIINDIRDFQVSCFGCLTLYIRSRTKQRQRVGLNQERIKKFQWTKLNRSEW